MCSCVAESWRDWSDAKLGSFLDIQGFAWIASDIPWTTKANLCEPGNPHYAQGSAFNHELAPECEDYIRLLARRVKAVRPHIKVLVYFHVSQSSTGSSALQ